MGWNRGLGRRTLNRLTWDTEQQPIPPSDNWVEKKVRRKETLLERLEIAKLRGNPNAVDAPPLD